MNKSSAAKFIKNSGDYLALDSLHCKPLTICRHTGENTMSKNHMMYRLISVGVALLFLFAMGFSAAAQDDSAADPAEQGAEGFVLAVRGATGDEAA